jgi:hypothetical protein
MDGAKHKLEFELLLPLDAASGATLDATRLTTRWNADEDLMSRIGRISSVKSQRMAVEGRPVEILRFEGALQDKDA